MMFLHHSQSYASQSCLAPEFPQIPLLYTFSKFDLVKSVENSKRKEVKMLSVKEFIEAYGKYVIGVER